MARLRGPPSGKVEAISAKAAGEAMAAPAPCRARHATSHEGTAASPPSREAVANRAMPTRNVRRCPNMSPARPPSSNSPPNASAYAVTTHCRPVDENARPCWISGSAMFTMVESRTTISWAAAMTVRTRPRRGDAGEGLSAEARPERMGRLTGTLLSRRDGGAQDRRGGPPDRGAAEHRGAAERRRHPDLLLDALRPPSSRPSMTCVPPGPSGIRNAVTRSEGR